MFRSTEPRTARRRRIDQRAVVIILAALTYLVAAYIDATTQPHTLLVIASCVVAACGVLAMGARSWWSVVAAGVSIAISVVVAAAEPLAHPPLIEILTLTTVVTVLAARARSTSDFGEVLLATMALAVIAVRVPATVEFLFLLAGAGAIAVGAGTLVRRHARRRHDAIERTRAEERADLSRDLHDLVAHHMTGIVVVAREARLESDTGRIEQLLEAIETAGSDALRESRRLVSRLRDTDQTGEPAPGTEDLVQLIRAFEASGATASVRADISAHVDDARTTALVLRVVQEALTNIQRHAYGTERVEVIVTTVDDHVEVTVDDLGVAGLTVPFALGTGTGLLGLRERLELVGGALDSRATARGWRVHASIPFGGAASAPKTRSLPPAMRRSS